MNPNDTYTSPLATRNASPEMLRLWSPRHKFNTWRRIWLAVAEAQYEVTKDWGKAGPSGNEGSSPQRAPIVREGPAPSEAQPLPHGRGSSGQGGSGSSHSGPLVTKQQVEELRAVVERGIFDEEIERASELERELRHDVMSHVHCLGEQCPKARAIIHLGCTSQDIVCNADAIIINTATHVIRRKVIRLILALGACASGWAAIPTLGFTHYQPAQPMTVGRRCANWASDLFEARPADHETAIRGVRGATGTQASFLALFDGCSQAVELFESLFINELSSIARGDGRQLKAVYLTGQTYPRVLDAGTLADLASIAAVLHKIATDIRLLSNRKELDEPFGDKQIGSSAMPYKRNPMKCERICGLSRFVMNLVGNAYDTAATQWLERTLDDSSNRRLSLPEAFLALDGALDLMHEVTGGLVVHEAMVRKNLMAELPFLATENILMEAVKAGADRQEYHEIIRTHAQAAGMRVKQEGLDNDLLDRLQADRAFWSTSRGGPLSHELDWSDLMDPMKYIGRSVEQTERFLKEVVEPLRERYRDDIEKLGSSDRGV